MARSKQQSESPNEEPVRLGAWEAAFENPQDYTIAKLIDEGISNERTKEVIYELFSSLGDVPIAPNDKRPEWARQAWREFWRSSALLPDAKHASEPKQLGEMMGLLAAIPTGAVKSPLDLADLHALMARKAPKVRSDAAQFPPKDAADFFNAQKIGQERAAQLTQISQRTKIFFLIAVAWREVAKFESTGELFQWLRSPGKNGKDFLAPSTDSREIRNVCKIIGLRYNSRGGRPSKKTRL